MDCIKISVEVRPGSQIGEAAKELCGLAGRLGNSIHTEFNGTPFRAYPGEQVADVCNRWSDERDHKTPG